VTLEILGPEGPGAALPGPDRIDPAALSLEQGAGAAPGLEDRESVRPFHIPAVELLRIEVQVSGHLQDVLAGHKYFGVRAIVPAALPALEAGELQSLLVPDPFSHGCSLSARAFEGSNAALGKAGITNDTTPQNTIA
jgi:hypothetical protein